MQIQQQSVYAIQKHIVIAYHRSKMPSPVKEAWQDTLHPFYVPSVHIQDYSQSILFLYALLRACQHSC